VVRDETSYSFHERSRSTDGAEDGVTGALLGSGIILFFILLVDEGVGDVLGLAELG
jgi:hypothetical protein